MSFEPPLSYVIRGHLNAIVWRLPIPRRLAGRISELVKRNPPMPPGLVVAVVETLRAAGVACWIRGGWGVDALAGRAMRVHDDLDLLVDGSEVARAAKLLEALGFEEQFKVDSERPLFSRVVLRDHPLAGRTVDLQPIDVASTDVEFATGAIEGSSVPCVSVAHQLANRATYRPRRVDLEDLAVLRRLAGDSCAGDRARAEREVRQPPVLDPGAAANSGRRLVGGQAFRAALAAMRQLSGRAPTALIVPVPAADELLDDSARVAGMPAHITVMYPFLPSRAIDKDAVHALAASYATIAPFEVTLAELGRFPNVVYLTPEPADALIALTQAVTSIWPDQVRYEGQYEQIVPHLTVTYGIDAPPQIERRLPLRVRVDEVWLMRRRGRRWVRIGHLRLGAAEKAPAA